MQTTDGSSTKVHRFGLFRHRVGVEETDELEHLNNVVYVRLMQEAALAHSARNGWPVHRYVAEGAGWVARRHEIEYRRPVFPGEELLIATWVAGMRKVSSIRRYRFYRPSDEALIAVAQTDWAFIDTRRGRPIRIPEAVSGRFAILGDQPESPPWDALEQALRQATSLAESDR